MNDAEAPLILLVDDEAAIRNLFSRYLGKKGYRTIEASNGNEAEAISAEQKVDAVLLDLLMPEIGGMDFINRNRDFVQRTPVIIVSAQDTIDAAVDALHAGAWDYISKPIDNLDVVLHAVEKAFERAALIAERKAYEENLEQEVRKKTRELREKSDALEKNERLFRAVYNQAYQFMAILEPNGRILNINATALKAGKLKQDDVEGRYFPNLPFWQVENDNRSKLEDAIRNSAAGEIVRFDTENRIAGDEILQIDFSLKPVWDSEGRIVNLIAEGRDISDRVGMERELYKESEFNKALIGSLPIFFIALDRRGRIQIANRSLQYAAGASKSALIGAPFTERLIRKNSHYEMQAMFQRILRGGGQETLNADLISSKSDPVPTEWHFTRLTDQEGKTELLFGVGIDLTERRNLERQRRRQEEELFQVQKMLSLGTLVSGIAHEINNPNNYIHLNAQNVKKITRSLEDSIKSRWQDYADIDVSGMNFETAMDILAKLVEGISAGSDRIKNLVATLKDFAAKQSGGSIHVLDIENVIQSALLILGNTIRKSTNCFRCELSPGELFVQGNFHQLEQVVMNLLTNACQALNAKNNCVELSTYQSPNKQYVIIRVSDEGSGIPAEVLPNIFDPFFTTKRDIGGTGLGLSVSYSIIMKHGGEMKFHSIEGMGTRVFVRLPFFWSGRGTG